MSENSPQFEEETWTSGRGTQLSGDNKPEWSIIMKSFQDVWAELDDGQREALGRKIARAQTGDEAAAEQVIRGVLSGKLRIKLVDGSIKFFDHTGRGIPLSGMKNVVDANRSFYVTQPPLNYAACLARLQQFFGTSMTFMSADEFETRCTAALARVADDEQIANLLKGPHFPFVMPQMADDLGTLLDDTIVPALDHSYVAQFPQRTLTNHRHGELAKQVTVISGTRQERLVAAMAKGSVCGVYFPALQGFGITADREFIGHLPEQVILAGMEVPVVVAAYPEIMGRDFKTPGLDMASLQWQSADYSLHFEAFDDEANFARRPLYARDVCSGGVSVLG